MHRQPAGRPDQAGPGRHDLALVPAGELARVLEHLMRASKIEGLEPIENNEGDAAVEHASTLQSALPWRQRQLFHDLRHRCHLEAVDGRSLTGLRVFRGFLFRGIWPISRDGNRPAGFVVCRLDRGTHERRPAWPDQDWPPGRGYAAAHPRPDAIAESSRGYSVANSCIAGRV